MAVTPTIEEEKRPASETDASADVDERARKRLQVGLSARRPTAKVAPTRPPDVQTLPAPAWVLATLLIAVLAMTGALLALNVTGVQPSWWPAWSTPGRADATQPTAHAATVAYSLRLAEDFSQPTPALTEGERADEWRTELATADSVYRVAVWPHHLAWSVLGTHELGGYRFQTNVQVAAPAADGYAGIIVRYQDERHFYVLSVDGQGRYAVQQQDGDEFRIVVPWTAAPFLNRAGSANVLTVEDDGTLVRFLGNGMLLYDLSDPAFGLGPVGLAGGAHGETPVTVEFDWIQLYDMGPAGG